MARTKAVLGAGARLSDFLAASLLARVVPADVVHAVLDEHGCNSQRIRSFPAVAGVYYCIALSLYPEAAYEEVFAVVSQGLAWAGGAAQPALVAKSSISSLRSRIGSAPLSDLVKRCCVPLANAQDHPHAFFAGLRLVAIDGSTFELPDEADNARVFGYPNSSAVTAGHAGFPQARCAVLIECATHAILGANIGAFCDGERGLAAALLPRLGPGMLCMADRGFNSFEHWRQAKATGADLLWRCGSTWKMPVQRVLDDGSFLSVIRPSHVTRAEADSRPSRCA